MNSGYEVGITEYDLLIFLLYSFISIAFIFIYKSFNSNEISKYLFPAFFLKILGGLCLALVYVYYYEGGGDCYFYYFNSSELTKVFYEKPSLYFKILFLDFEEAKLLLKSGGYAIESIRESETFFFSKFQSPLNILSFNSYLGLTFFNSLISYITTISLFKLLLKIIKNSEINIFIICFCIPSVLMWGSGLLKDTITMSCFNVCVVLLYNIIYKKIKLSYIIGFLICAYLILGLKPYIFVAFLSWITFTIFYYFIIKSKNPILKFLLVPYLGIIVISSLFFVSTTLLQNSSEYKVDDIYDRIKGFHDYHVFLKGSAYDLGPLDYSVFGLLSKFPQAVNVTLFRPYPWEASGGLFFLNSLESFFIFLFVIFTMIKLKTINLFKFWNKNSFVIGAIVFSIFYSFVIGVTSYNFGALSRFKIPMVPIFLFCILYTRNYKLNNESVIKNV